MKCSVMLVLIRVHVCVQIDCMCVFGAALDSSVKLDHDNKLWDLMRSQRIRGRLHPSVFITDLIRTYT